MATHRKIHLFDIGNLYSHSSESNFCVCEDIPGKMTFKESDALNPGNSFTTFPTPWCEVGVGICYDIRFAELAQVYAQKGCKLLVYPGAFNMTTGTREQTHWGSTCCCV